MSHWQHSQTAHPSEGCVFLTALYQVLAMPREGVLRLLLSGKSCGTFKTGRASDAIFGISLYFDAI